jgi:predicted helicase
MVNNILRSATVKFKNRKVDALTVAHMLATQHAVHKHGVNKLISFHSRVDKACDFQAMVGEHWFDLLNNFNAQHVSGAMPASQRAQQITSFKNSSNGVLTNARCLTEGIDVPVVDMVAFLCNKRSRIDIVQAAGRVMRKAPGKQTGYILLPFYIKNDETHHIEETLKKLKHADYSDIWYILKILADYDDSLKDIINISLSCQDEIDNVSHSILSKKIIII